MVVVLVCVSVAGLQHSGLKRLSGDRDDLVWRLQSPIQGSQDRNSRLVLGVGTSMKAVRECFLLACTLGLLSLLFYTPQDNPSRSNSAQSGFDSSTSLKN